MNYQMLMDTAIRVGEIMLSHGAEAHRVEDTVCRMLKTANLKTTEVFVIMTGMFATLSDPSMETITVTKRVRNKGNNLKQICYANEISRRFCAGEITLERAHEMATKGYAWEYAHFTAILGNMLVITFFPPLVGGDLRDCFVAFLSSLLVGGGIYLSDKMHTHPFLKDLVNSFLAGFAVLVLNWLLPFEFHQDAIIIACIMPLVPGVAITNAVRDTLNGDYVSGAARAVEAFIKALSIALGVGLSLILLGGVLA